MPRLPIPVGSFGTISRARLKDGTWSARTYVRDLDGERRLVSRRGPSGAAAERELKKALAERTAPARSSLGPTTRLRDVAERWYRDVQADVEAGEKSPNTARLYRHYLDRNVLPGVGALRLGEATVARLDDFVSAVGTRSGSGAAKACRSVLSGVMGYAARYGAIPTNPVRDIGRVRGTRHPAPGTRHPAPGTRHPAPGTRHPAPGQGAKPDDRGVRAVARPAGGRPGCGPS